MDEGIPEMTGRDTVTKIISMQKQNLLPRMHIIGYTSHYDKEIFCRINFYSKDLVLGFTFRRLFFCFFLESP